MASPPTRSSPPSHPEEAPKGPHPRFTLELEFVLALSNPYYISHLAVTYPELLIFPSSSSSTAAEGSRPTNSPTSPSQPARFSPETSGQEEEHPSVLFARYLEYLYAYWRSPQYSKYLTHPGAVLRTLELLQQETFRRDLVMKTVEVVGKLVAVEQVELGVKGDTKDGAKDEGGKEGATMTAQLRTGAEGDEIEATMT